MSADIVDKTLDFMVRIVDESKPHEIKVTFHGGEPLMAGHTIWHRILDGVASRFGSLKPRLAIQSNLWFLDDAFCRLFRKHKVEIGTSLDGPEEITDHQRGPGYFARTMQSIRQAKSFGMTVGCIATFTPASLHRWREVFDFFLGERISFSVHPAVPSLGDLSSAFALSPAQYASLLIQMLDYYVNHRQELTVSSLDQMCQGLGSGEGKVCTFRDCLGMFLAIDPLGDIYSCQRFAGRPQHRLGTVNDQPTLGTLLSSPVAKRLACRQQSIRKICHRCIHLNYCTGGCPYNAWAGNNPDRVKDPYCEAYSRVFDHIQRRLCVEMASEENINATAEEPYAGTGHPLLRRGPLTELARGGPHPYHIARTAKRIIAAVELARGPDFETVANRLVALGISRTQHTAEASLTALQQRLHPSTVSLNNLYFHVTFDCQLHCSHCYARADACGRSDGEMSVPVLAKIIREAKEAGFRQVIITGGEPLIHSQYLAMLTALAEMRSWIQPTRLVLRTNLAMPLADGDLHKVARAFDQVVVSVDGSEKTHNDRRGKGSHAATVRNLERFPGKHGLPSRPSIGGIATGPPSASSPVSESGAPILAHAGSYVAENAPAELSLTCVMRAGEIQGVAGQAVRELAGRLGVRRIRFRPLLPIGRAKEWDEPPTSEALGAHSDPLELIYAGFHPVASCGLGQNLYVEPSGESFPCYAYHQPHALLGNVVETGLLSVLLSGSFRDLARYNVDTNPKCRTCDMRYLCGGACRAWGGDMCQGSLNAPPIECAGLLLRAKDIYMAARKRITESSAV